MLEKIKAAIFTNHKPEEILGLFLSLYDGQGVLLASNGVVTTDKGLDTLIDLLYHGIVEKFPTTIKIIADIVRTPTIQSDINQLLTISPADYGVLMINKSDTKSGVLLPATPGATDMKTALMMIKSKYALAGDVEIYTFTTERLTIE